MSARRAIGGAIALLVVGCGGTDTGGGAQAFSEAIVGGAIAPSPSVGVARILSETGESPICTATVLAPRLLLTARHCVARVDEAPFACDANGSPLGGSAEIFGDVEPASLAIRLPTSAPGMIDARAVAIRDDGARVLCGHDLALVLLDRELPDASTPALRLARGAAA